MDSKFKPGEERKILFKGKRYIIVHDTETTGKAYFRVKQNNNSEVRGEYAGTFTVLPPNKIEITPPKEGNSGPAAKAEAPTAPRPTSIPKNTQKDIKPTAVQKDEKPKAVATAKKLEVKPPPPPKVATVTKKATVKPPPSPPQPPYTGYFQRQEGLGCGRHALNNLFGREVFKKGAKGDVVPFPPPAEPISLLGVCTTVSKILKGKGLTETCLSSENYDTNTIHAALDMLGYPSEQYTREDTFDESGDFVGFIINLGLVSGKPKHWIALKFKRRADDSTVYYDYFDSLNARPAEDITYNIFSLQHPQTYIIKVLPKGAPINPADRFVYMPNVVESPKVTKTAAKAGLPTDCSKLYDPCTRLEVKDLPALEARVAELKAKQKKEAPANDPKEVKAGGTRRKMKKRGRKTRRSRRV